jgi:hypothetical protein
MGGVGAAWVQVKGLVILSLVLLGRALVLLVFLVAVKSLMVHRVEA